MQNLIAVFGAFWDKYMFWINRPNVTVTDIVEIIIIAFLLYHILPISFGHNFSQNPTMFFLSSRVPVSFPRPFPGSILQFVLKFLYFTG